MRGRETELQITVTRSGGFGGIMRTWTARVSGVAARDWRILVSASIPADAASAPAPERSAKRTIPGEPDRFLWTVLVRDGDDKRSLRWPEAELTPAARDLIERVQQSPDSARRSAAD